MSVHLVTIYGRPECHLCSEAERRIREIAQQRRAAIDVQNINIELDDDLHRLMFERIPVIEIDGEYVGELGDYRRRSFAERVSKALIG